MNFVTKLEQKFGKYAIRNLPLYMVIIYAAGYMMNLVSNGRLANLISLNPHAILQGQVWRLISWIMIPPESSEIFFLLITLYFYYSISRSLEAAWGSFYFNFYVLCGVIFTLIAGFLFFGYSELFTKEAIAVIDETYALKLGDCPEIYGGSWYYTATAREFSTYYINMAVFLAFAATYPDSQVLLMFIIPIKVKVLGIIDAVFLIVMALTSMPVGLFVVGAAFANFGVFILLTSTHFKRSPKMRARQKEFKRKAAEGMRRTGTIAKHKCAICGRTSDEYPDLEFRFCSKCEGNYEYCQDHLFTHKHFKREGT